jgi:hypothetical protein
MTAPTPETSETPQEAPVAPESGTPPAEPEAKPTKTPEEYETELAKVRREAAGYRVKLKEVEPLARAAQEAEEAKKDDIQRANERAQAAEKRENETLEKYTRMEVAITHHLDPEDIDLLGSGSREEMEDRAKRIAAKNAAAAKAGPPPTDRPVEGLRPGASPEPASPPDDSYPEQWKPTWLRGNDRDSRIIHGQ